MSEELYQRWTDKTREWVRLDGVANRMEKLEKILFSEIVQRLEGSVAAREHQARASNEYKSHCSRMIDARTAANTTRAEADGMKMQWETWRTINATRRKEMGLL